MLQDIRDNSQGVIAKVIVGLIVAVFALWGVESIIGGFIRTPPVAEVNGEEITDIQLQTNAQNLMNSIGAQAGDFDQQLLEQIALDQLIEEMVLLQHAENNAMAVSSDRIDRAIIETQQFQIDGRFDPDLAIRTMAAQGFSVPLYRQNLQQRMVLSQLANAYTSSNFVTESELQKIIELSAQTRDFRYLSVTMGTRTLGTAISDEEIQEYYDANQEQFTEQESVALRYVVLDQDLIAEEIEVDEGELQAQYEAERSAFEGSAEKRASHILLEVGPDLNEAQALELAATARQRLLDGEEFGAVALELSSDTLSAEAGGDIGYTDGTAFPPEIEEALETMAVDEVSEPVITEFGVHLVKLTEASENTYPSFDEVRERIERDLKASEVELRYAERLEDLSNLAFESGDLTAISQQLSLPIAESAAITRQGGAGDLANPQVLTAAFSDEVLLEGNNSDVIEISPTRSLVLRVSEYNEASVLPMEEVQPEIAVILRTEMEREAVQQTGDRLLTALEQGEDIQPILEEEGIEWIDATSVERNDTSVNREIVNAIFAMPRPEGESLYNSVQLANGTFVVVELNAVNPGSIETIAESERDNILSTMQTDFGSSDFQSYLLNLRANADIRTALASDEGF